MPPFPSKTEMLKITEELTRKTITHIRTKGPESIKANARLILLKTTLEAVYERVVKMDQDAAVTFHPYLLRFDEVRADERRPVGPKDLLMVLCRMKGPPEEDDSYDEGILNDEADTIADREDLDPLTVRLLKYAQWEIGSHANSLRKVVSALRQLVDSLVKSHDLAVVLESCKTAVDQDQVPQWLHQRYAQRVERYLDKSLLSMTPTDRSRMCDEVNTLAASMGHTKKMEDEWEALLQLCHDVSADIGRKGVVSKEVGERMMRGDDLHEIWKDLRDILRKTNGADAEMAGQDLAGVAIRVGAVGLVGVTEDLRQIEDWVQCIAPR